ncbi:MAG: aldehyde dehydrogenase family protein [Planctomycetota bacterium]|nr:aldehyde dehydrogenase family protein [Planctomycetota bacterium]
MHRVASPYSGKIVCELPFDGEDGRDSKIAAASSAQRQWSRIPVGERARRIHAALDHFRSEKAGIAEEITLQMGKPLHEALAEVDTMLGRAEHAIAMAEEVLSPDLPPEKANLHLRIEHEALGVVFNIAAWNYPLLIAVNFVVPALLAGNTVLLKHSAKTPLCGIAFEQAFQGLVWNLVLTHEDTACIIKDPRIAHVGFTGSVQGGQEVQRAASGRFIDVGLELGGKDPAYVASDADLEAAVPGIVEGACYNAGQSCCAIERVYVHSSLHDEFIDRATAAMESLTMGDPLDKATTLGPLASAKAPAFLEQQIDGAVAGGARLITGGKRIDERFFPPSLLTGCANDSTIMQEESFGPLLPVLAVSGDDEAIALANDTRFGLTASVWTTDRERAERYAREVEAGTIYQNRCDFIDPSLTWTGYKDSGKGETLSRYGLYHLTRRKSIHFRNGP